MKNLLGHKIGKNMFYGNALVVRSREGGLDPLREKRYAAALKVEKRTDPSIPMMVVLATLLCGMIALLIVFGVYAERVSRPFDGELEAADIAANPILLGTGVTFLSTAFLILVFCLPFYFYEVHGQKVLMKAVSEFRASNITPRERDFFSVPDEAICIDVFYCGERRNKMARNYINREVLAYRDGAAVCLCDLERVIRIPFSCIKQVSKINRPICAVGWNKTQPHDGLVYSSYKIVQYGVNNELYWARHCYRHRWFYKMQILYDGVGYELLYPAYEHQRLSALMQENVSF